MALPAFPCSLLRSCFIGLGVSVALWCASCAGGQEAMTSSKLRVSCGPCTHLCGPNARRIALSQCWHRAASTSLVQLSWSVMGLMPPCGFGNPMTMLRCHSAATVLDTFPPVQRFTQASAVSNPSLICSKSIHKPFRQPLGPGSAPSLEPSDASRQGALADAGVRCRFGVLFRFLEVLGQSRGSAVLLVHRSEATALRL